MDVCYQFGPDTPDSVTVEVHWVPESLGVTTLQFSRSQGCHSVQIPQGAEAFWITDLSGTSGPTGGATKPA